MMPSFTDPPRIGTLTIKELFIFWSIARVLTSNTKVRTENIFHSLLEKVEKAELISDLLGNEAKIFNCRMRPHRFFIREI